MWSRKLIPKIPQALPILWVISISSFEGSESPLGWLCTNTIEAALLKIAAFKTSLGCTSDFARPVKSFTIF